ncbi:hypothetical protein HYW32_03290 [Candidatus Berkelbacteria bacterium]|nr:hypothetical protein [Candidatus Berkelbacteria bacterium]
MNRPIVIGIGLGVNLILAGVTLWLIMRAVPMTSDIESARTKVEPAPKFTIKDIEALKLDEKTLNGDLPISIDGVGRVDPYAGI